MRDFFLILLCFAKICYAANEEEGKYTTVVNRLVRTAVSVETSTPILAKPNFVVPQGAKLLDSYLKVICAEKEKCQAQLEILLFFEKAGDYSIGPFIFIDKEGNSHTASPLKFTVLNKDVIPVTVKSLQQPNRPVRFFTVKPQDKLYANGYVFFVLDVPVNYKNVEIYWEGWEDIYTERLPEITEKNDNYEIKFVVFFNKAKKYNLKPLKIKVKKDEDEQFFATPAFNFDVEKIPDEVSNIIGIGEGNIKINIYTATYNNYVQLDLVYSGTGNLYNIKLPQLEILPAGELFLRKKWIEFFEYIPEIKGAVHFSYILIPPKDGLYQVKLQNSKIFDPKRALFRNISGYTTTINVMLPSNPDRNPNESIIEKLNIKQKPDYDFYAVIIGLCFITFLALGLYLRKLKKTKKKVKSGRKYRYDDFLIVQRAILSYLKFFVGYDMATLSFSQIKKSVLNSKIGEDLKKEIVNWLEEAFKVRYLEKDKVNKEEILKVKGIEILRKMKEERKKL